MNVSGLNHYTIRCTPPEVDGIREFYTRVLRLQVGDRPTMPRPGCWLYGTQGTPIVHIYAALDDPIDAATGSLDHISFSVSGLYATRTVLREAGIAFDVLHVHGTSIHQIFLRDPKGLKVELTFDLELEAGEK